MKGIGEERGRSYIFSGREENPSPQKMLGYEENYRA